MSVLILSPRFTEDSRQLRQAAERRGWRVVRPPGWRVEAPEALAGLPVAIYGEPLFAAAVAAQVDRVLLEPPLDWLAGLPMGLRGREVGFGSFAAVKASSSWPRFVKPADDKRFAARVYASAEELPPVEQVGAEAPVLTSAPVRWLREFRCFVCEGAVVTASLYARAGDLQLDAAPGELEEAVEFARGVIAHPEVVLPPALVLDVGETQEAGWCVVEANPCFGAGVYACDPDQVLTTVARACRPAAAASPEEQRWILCRGLDN